MHTSQSTSTATTCDVVLLLGGDSPEREVSLMSGGNVLQALNRLGVSAQTFDPAKQTVGELAAMCPQRAFNLLHGGAGENGEIQGLLGMLGIPYSGSGVLASALAMDKHRTKLLWRAAGIPTADWRLVAPDNMDGDCMTANDVDEIIKDLGLPLFVKPSCGGSSTSMSRVEEAAALPAAIDLAAGEGATVLVEKCIVGCEYTASIVNDKTLPLIKITPAGIFYDYHAKYAAEDTGFACPCGLPTAMEEKLQKISLQAFQLLGCRHWGRVDFILSDAEPYFLEVNTVPGMTSHSLVPMAAQASGMDYDMLIKTILAGVQS